MKVCRFLIASAVALSAAFIVGCGAVQEIRPQTLSGMCATAAPRSEQSFRPLYGFGGLDTSCKPTMTTDNYMVDPLGVIAISSNLGTPATGAGTLTRLEGSLDSGTHQTVGQTMRVYINGAQTSLRCVITRGPDASDTCVDDVDVASVKGGDLVAVTLDLATNQQAANVLVTLHID